MKGWKTIAFNVASVLVYLLGYDQITTLVPALTPQVVGSAQAIINIVLRFLTTTPVGKTV